MVPRGQVNQDIPKIPKQGSQELLYQQFLFLSNFSIMSPLTVTALILLCSTIVASISVFILASNLASLLSQ